MADPSSGSDPASVPDGPYQTSPDERFISPFAPFLTHIAFVEEGAPIFRWCEQRRIYYALCTHIVNFNRCHHPMNPTGVCNPGACRYPPEYVVYTEYLCPVCQRRGRAEPPPTEDELDRSNSEWRARANWSRDNFFQLVSDAGQDGNLALQELEDPEELFENPDILGQEILAEMAAAEMDEMPFSDEEEDEREDEADDAGPPPVLPPLPDDDDDRVEFDVDERDGGGFEGWWFARLAWRNNRARELGHRPALYYVPDVPGDETGLLVRAGPVPVGASCSICMIDFGAEGDEGEDVRRLPCGHLFHYGCILMWLYNRNCPFCRRMYVLRGIPTFVDEREGSSSSLSDLGETPTPPYIPPASPPSPGVPHIGGIPLIPGGVLGGQRQGGPQQGGPQQGGPQQGGQQQGGQHHGGLPIRTVTNRPKTTYPYNSQSTGRGGGNQEGGNQA
ncbi:hypothetical protein VE04_05817 [Pseudogymnoascus sp. 24MN13]|nr:hypothetical protein VE04_05817 [Pseudogymnoascus sp. 24MN13]